MAIILGTSTTLLIDGTSDGFQSVSWSISRQPNRLWQLGSWDPYRTQVVATVNVNVSSYAGALTSLNSDIIRPSTSCEFSPARKSIQLVAYACDPTNNVDIDYSDMYITSYSYSKGDPTGFGTESWSFQTWIDPNLSGSEFLSIPTPSHVLQGISEGQRSGNVTNLGVSFLSSGLVSGQEGSVSAGVPGLGNANTVELGIVNGIGGGSLEEYGKDGSSSASIPHTPLYVI